MADDIVNRLKGQAPNGYVLMHEAADLIENLRQRLHDCNEYALRLQNDLERCRERCRDCS
jgi:hypothetical protein